MTDTKVILKQEYLRLMKMYARTACTHTPMSTATPWILSDRPYVRMFSDKRKRTGYRTKLYRFAREATAQECAAVLRRWYGEEIFRITVRTDWCPSVIITPQPHVCIL